MTQRTEEVWTDYGKVEVDVVECTSCGNDVRREDAEEFSIGDAQGWACSACRDEGPIRFPGTGLRVGGWEGAVASVLLYPLLVAALYADGRDERWRLAAVSGAGSLAWAGVLYGLFEAAAFAHSSLVSSVGMAREALFGTPLEGLFVPVVLVYGLFFILSIVLRLAR